MFQFITWSEISTTNTKHLHEPLFRLTAIYQVQVEQRYAHRLKVADYHSVILGSQKRASDQLTQPGHSLKTTLIYLNLNLVYRCQAKKGSWRCLVLVVEISDQVIN